VKTYDQALSFLNSFLNLEQIPKPHSRIWNLKRMRELLRIFGHPEKGIFTVLIGGTKGKGSTGYFLSEILRQSGLRTGFYHSPHLESPLERIWIGGKPVSSKDFAKGLGKIRKTLRRYVIARSPAQQGGATKQSRSDEIASGALHPRNDDKKFPFTYFEIMTLLACLLFKEKKVKAAVFEAGMGGRLDATHVLPAKLVILTTIHYDHEAFLGNTLAQIAREKAALLVPHGRAVVAPQLPEAAKEIRKTARKRANFLLSPVHLNGMPVGLLGDFQKLNAGLAVRAASVLREEYGFPIPPQALKRGLLSGHWPGRMELFRGRPAILLDGAHNPHSITALCRNLKKLFPNKRKILVFGTSRDKRSDRMIPALEKIFDTCILTRSGTTRAKEVGTLLYEARGHFREIIPMDSSKKALALAREIARPDDLIVVTGSFYLIGELRPLCRN